MASTAHDAPLTPDVESRGSRPRFLPQSPPSFVFVSRGTSRPRVRQATAPSDTGVAVQPRQRASERQRASQASIDAAAVAFNVAFFCYAAFR